ncbi:MAG: DUF4837 family protein [Crocinitomicaceae bacterium]|nr:DUF4837 family protein [Crocinitomicaceae bacterium]MDG1776679.1 DUF4837 family protein [Crocinitomicaceae bacterium]
MAIRAFSISALLVLFFSFGCESSHNANVTRGLSVTGKVGEILVVCDQGVWNSEIKNHLDTGLTHWIMPYFPDVPTFQLVHKTPAHFTQGVKRYRNTLFITIDPSYKGEHGSIVKRTNVWAIGQLVVEITGKDYNQVLETCKLGLEEVHAEFDTKEWSRIKSDFSRNKNKKIRDGIKQNFGINIELPRSSKQVSSRKNFCRIEFPAASRPIEFVGTGTEDVGSIFSGVLIYQYDYIDSSQFQFENLLAARDTMLKYNVPHEIEGMYMGTQYNEFVYPEGNISTTADGKLSGFEMRGMFMFKGLPKHSTGGAFWAYHFKNEATNKMMCVSGYVDAPSTTSWTHPLREIQAILKSVEIVR